MQQKQTHAKKRLGQNFLRDSGIIQEIIWSLELKQPDVVLEIGCGTGSLTQRLMGKVGQLIGVELDRSLFHDLQCLAAPGAVFLNEDILTLDLEPLRQQFLRPGEKFKVVGNLPYYISSPILHYLALRAGLLERAVIMVQAEVADRLVAEAGSKEYGVLTLLTRYYFDIRELMTVPPSAFKPAPSVYSKVVRLTPRPTRELAQEKEDDFLDFLKQSFSQRRKTLRNALKSSPRWNHDSLEDLLEELRYPRDARAETITMEDFVILYRKLAMIS